MYITAAEGVQQQDGRGVILFLRTHMKNKP